MIRRQQDRIVAKPRRAFTLLELLVVISIIAGLMSLILPAIQSARRAARRTECMNNLRNCSVAMLGYVSTHRRFPAAGYWAGIPGSRYPSHNWVVDLLPYVDRQDLADRWDHTVPYSATPNKELGDVMVAVLTCPEDSSVRGSGDLSFAVNSGIGYTTFLSGVHDVPVNAFGNAIDLNGNGTIAVADDSLDGTPSDRTILKALGLFFMENFGENRGVVRHYTTNFIRDGFSNTLMLIENVRTGRNSAAPDENWATPFAPKSAVFFSSSVCSANVCSSGNVDFARANTGPNRINAGLREPEGRSPFANSEHAGIVNVAFADGSVKGLSEDIDGTVYAALFSPSSRILDSTTMQQVIPSADQF
jgi:prepilin-type N-terminal cleavage/methylation domain-containing protein/prepilin-type processing-associated H-X9-DG protein